MEKQFQLKSSPSFKTHSLCVKKVGAKRPIIAIKQVRVCQIIRGVSTFHSLLVVNHENTRFAQVSFIEQVRVCQIMCSDIEFSNPYQNTHYA